MSALINQVKHVVQLLCSINKRKFLWVMTIFQGFYTENNAKLSCESNWETQGHISLLFLYCTIKGQGKNQTKRMTINQGYETHDWANKWHVVKLFFFLIHTVNEVVSADSHWTTCMTSHHSASISQGNRPYYSTGQICTLSPTQVFDFPFCSIWIDINCAIW